MANMLGWMFRLYLPFKSVEPHFPIGSLETTHGVIRLSSDKPAIFVSAITDREGNFDMKVMPVKIMLPLLMQV